MSNTFWVAPLREHRIPSTNFGKHSADILSHRVNVKNAC